jgi:predicted ferric reductase
MKWNRQGPLIFWGVALLVIPLWLISFPDTTVRHNPNPLLVYGSQVAALTGFVLFALTFVLSTRMRWIEDLFGGLDKVYHMHHTLGKAALILILAHPLMLAMRFIPEEPGRLAWYLFPVHRQFEINIGSWALWGLLVLMILTIPIRLPYDKWKISHRLMGLFFVMAVVHLYLTTVSFTSNPALASYLTAISLAGVSSWVYKSILYGRVVNTYKYRVGEVDHLNNNVVEVRLKPDREGISYIPGQFCFFSFHSSGLTRESHPYTVCSMTKEGEITILVKALGDYTNRLYKHLKPGDSAHLEGPYGRFDYRNSNRKQVWIGGGVGIAPFISWANDLLGAPLTDLHIELYYCVNTESDATHIQLFEDLEKRMDGFSVHLVPADMEGFVNPGKIPSIAEKEIFICGPKEMRKNLLPELRSLGVPVSVIHYEDFDFA